MEPEPQCIFHQSTHGADVGDRVVLDHVGDPLPIMPAQTVGDLPTLGFHERVSSRRVPHPHGAPPSVGNGYTGERRHRTSVRTAGTAERGIGGSYAKSPYVSVCQRWTEGNGVAVSDGDWPGYSSASWLYIC